MKSIKIIFASLAIVLTVSCETHYRMITILDRDGKSHREIYAFGDSAFMAGNLSENPFLFKLNEDWKIIHLDTIIRHDFFGNKGKLNVKISKSVTSIENYSKEIHCDEYKQSFAIPEESLEQKFKWFYTNYSFKTVYKKLEYAVPVSIDNYLSKEEQILWTQGYTENYKILNGAEMNDYLSEISDKFMDWQSRNYFEISLECVKKLTNEYNLDTDKENIYKQTVDHVQRQATDIEIETICTVLDAFYKTNHFSQLYKTNKEILDNEFETALLIVNHIFNVISYELVIPGTIIKTNAPIIRSDTLIWKIDGIRLLFDNYLLTVEYQVINIWAFLLAGLFLLIAVGSLVQLRYKRSGQTY